MSTESTNRSTYSVEELAANLGVSRSSTYKAAAEERDPPSPGRQAHYHFPGGHPQVVGAVRNGLPLGGVVPPDQGRCPGLRSRGIAPVPGVLCDESAPDRGSPFKTTSVLERNSSMCKELHHAESCIMLSPVVYERSEENAGGGPEGLHFPVQLQQGQAFSAPASKIKAATGLETRSVIAALKLLREKKLITRSAGRGNRANRTTFPCPPPKLPRR